MAVYPAHILYEPVRAKDSWAPGNVKEMIVSAICKTQHSKYLKLCQIEKENCCPSSPWYFLQTCLPRPYHIPYQLYPIALSANKSHDLTLPGNGKAWKPSSAAVQRKSWHVHVHRKYKWVPSSTAKFHVWDKGTSKSSRCPLIWAPSSPTYRNLYNTKI